MKRSTLASRALEAAEEIDFAQGKIMAALELADILITRLQEHAEGDKYLQIVKDELDEIDDPIIRVRMMITEAVSKAMKSEYLESLKELKQVEEMADEIEDKSFLPILYSRMGNVYSLLFKFDEALEYLYKGLKLCTKENKIGGMANYNTNIALIYQSLLDYNKSIEHLKLALDLYEKIGDKQGLARSHGNLLVIYCVTRDFDKSLYHGKLALEQVQVIQDNRQHCLILNNIGEMYKQSGDLDEAMNYFRQSLELAQSLNLESDSAVAANNLGDCHLLKEEYVEMEKCLDYSLPILKKFNLLPFLKNNYYMRAESAHDTERDHEAYDYLKEFMEINNQILTEETAKKSAELRTKFEVERMEQENEIFRLKNVELAEANKKLQEALDNIKVLSGLVPICSHCKKIRDDKGFWNHLETYISKHSKARFSHGICPDCMVKLYPDFAEGVLKHKSKEEQNNDDCRH